ncbi:uncharacterized protein LOC121972363 [Zingiber officinale]|uniref:uncharacterized protein LOC121972363 n=1 Tax=Zingiber officinale TaxID=94328 RepID=UPI001C4BBE73|nr:uncharacterized protein LOC121972363 [Zingiber officinale]
MSYYGILLDVHPNALLELHTQLLLSSKETDIIPTPKVINDQDSNPDATIVEVAFGDRLGALLDTVRVLCEKAKEVLMEESNVQANCSICSKLTKILDKIQLLTRLFCALLFYL